MNKRSAIATAATVFTVLAAATSCSSPAPASSKPTQVATSPATSPSAYPVSDYLQELRKLGTDFAATRAFIHLTPDQSSDAKLVSLGREACADLEHHDPKSVWKLLQHEGWTAGEADQAMGAATLTFCPAHYQEVADWEVAMDKQ